MAELTLVFTDIADSTAVVERLGAEGAAELWSKHDDATRVLFERYHGREIDRTDGFFVVFESTYDAARFALEYQTVVRRLSLHARIGIHRGTVALRSNSADAISRGAKGVEIEGVAKPMAARVMALASPGQTLLSAAAQTALGDRLPVDAEIMCHGHFRLKGVEEPIEIFQLAASTTSLFAPPADAEKAYRVVKSGELWRPARDIPNNLLSERDGFVGRGIDLRTIAGRFEGGTRLLTLVGPGGTGKTRLATRYARAWLGSWPGGVYFCDLSDARSLEGIYYAVGGALQVQLGKEDPTDQIARAISTRGQCLFILDNFEQVVEHAAITVGRWADRAALAAFLVTSRERLHLQGESVLPIGPLSLADDAVDLFVLRTQAQRAEFSLTEANLSPVREIARLLDGLPLAIELAAARMGVFSAVQLATRLKHRFEVLVVPQRGPDRQATLQTTIDWSWNLLNVDEQSALAQCSVFEGGFTLEAAEQVICLPAATGGAVSQALQALVDKSLLRAWVPARASRGGSDGLRFGAYMSVHEYVSGKLRESDRTASLDIDVRHGRYFGHFGTDEYLDLLSERAGDEHRSELALELDNLIAAFRRATNRGDSEVAASAFRASWEVLEQRGPLSTAAAMADQVLVLPQLRPETRLAADLCAARALWRIGRTGEAVPVLEQGICPVA